MPHMACQTVQGGPVVGAFCRFPFRYKDVEYNMCTLVDHLTPDAIDNTESADKVNQTPQGWCATKVDVHGDYVPHHWGICEPKCHVPKSKYRVRKQNLHIWSTIYIQLTKSVNFAYAPCSTII